VIQEKIRIDNCEQKKFLKEKKLLNKKYLYYGGLIKESKNVDVLLRSFNHYVRHKIDDLYLVVSGLIKTNNIELIGLLNSERVIYLGNLKRNEVLMVIKGAQVCVNISDNEGLPRFCLESIALEKKVVLPKNVPEFEAYYYNNIAFEFDEKSVAEKILSVYENEMAVNYPIDRHFSQNVVERYLSVFEDK
jgi:glycosyltransferase involved in cell wall biosynthesis